MIYRNGSTNVSMPEIVTVTWVPGVPGVAVTGLVEDIGWEGDGSVSPQLAKTATTSKAPTAALNNSIFRILPLRAIRFPLDSTTVPEYTTAMTILPDSHD